MRLTILSVPRVCVCLTSLAIGFVAPSAHAHTTALELTAPDPGRSLEAPPPTSGGSGEASLRGWPVNLHSPGAGFPYTPTLFDVDHDGAAEIFLTGGETFGLRGDGSFLPGWPTTEQLYMGYGTNEQKPGPSAADLEGDGDVEIMWSERDWWAGSAHMWCFNGRESDGSNVPGFPQYAPDDYSNALDVPFVLGDADHDGDLEAWGPHTLGNNFVHYRVSAFDEVGNRLFTRDLSPTENILDLYYGDVVGDGIDEFFAISWQDPTMRLYVFTADGHDAPGFPTVLGTFSGGYLAFGPPIPVDMDKDGDLEFLIGYNSGTSSRAHARHHDGSVVTGYPITIAYSSQLFYLGLGDLTGDGEPELLALDNYLSGTNRAFAFTLANGNLLAGWPVFINDWPHGFPTSADVDGDGRQDFCLSTEGGQVFAIAADGSILPGYPKTMASPSISGVAAGDIDGDGLFELVASTWDGWVYAWDTTGPALPWRADWPMRGIDARNTGVFHRADVADVSTDIGFGQRLTITPNPVRGSAEILLRGARDGSTIAVVDVTGRCVDMVTLRSGGARWRPGAGLSPGVYLIRAEGAGGPIQGGRLVLLK